MYIFRESYSRRALSTALMGSLGRIAISLIMVTGLAGVGSASAAPSQVGPDTARAGMLQSLLAAVPLEMSYISRLSEPSVEEMDIVLERPSEEPRAAAYARRYGISPELSLDIVEHALAEGLDPELGFRLVRVESVFKVTARGRQGALGLTQLMPSTARALDRTLDTEREVLDPDRNLRTGFRYLRQMIQHYGDVRLGVLAYNRGPVAVDRALRRGTDPENGYSHLVLGTRGADPYAGTGLAPQPDAPDANVPDGLDSR